MKSAGNDIVALDAINIERTNDSRFYSKFITPPELALYSLDIPFESFVWLLWSAKEAAYKYWQRNQPNLIFSPGKLIIQSLHLPPNFTPTPLTSICESTNQYQLVTGTISNGQKQLHFHSIVFTNVLATVVNADEDFDNVYWGIQQIPQTDSQSQSASVRAFALNKLSDVLKAGELSIAKSEVGHPVVLKSDLAIDIPLSFAHHEEFVGYSFLI
ncbi:MAG: 4'-phosphopantetheinyl transferase superfamily protein [Mucilaginibacter sp.]